MPVACPPMRIGARTFDFRREVAVMAIVNRTPDSFYDRGRSFALGAAVEHALAQVEAGADLIDVGGVKAGPGEDVPVAVERERVIPFVEAFRGRSDAPLSVDTFRARIAEEALAAGADMINDTSGLYDPLMPQVLADRPDAALVLMHNRHPPRVHVPRPNYVPDVTTAVRERLSVLVGSATAAGVQPCQLLLDPGHDFAKNTFHSVEITQRLSEIGSLGFPLVVAMSRKAFLGEAVGLSQEHLLEPSLAAAVFAIERGARIVRVHDTSATVRAVRTVEVLHGWRLPARPARGLD